MGTPGLLPAWQNRGQPEDPLLAVGVWRGGSLVGLSARPVGLVTNAGAGVRVELGHLVSEELEEDLVSEVFSVQPERELPF